MSASHKKTFKDILLRGTATGLTSLGGRVVEVRSVEKRPLLRFRQRHGFEAHLAHQRGEARIGAHDVEGRIGIHPPGGLVVLIDTPGQPLEGRIHLSHMSPSLHRPSIRDAKSRKYPGSRPGGSGIAPRSSATLQSRCRTCPVSHTTRKDGRGPRQNWARSPECGGIAATRDRTAAEKGTAAPGWYSRSARGVRFRAIS